MPPLHHVVKVRPSSAIKVPDDFPLNEDDQIDCSTCHGIRDIAEIPLDEVDKKDRDFFRQGPYKQFSDFCYRCHEKKDYPRNNIHKMIDEHGKLKKKNCLYCHKKTLDPQKKIDRSRLEFRLPMQKLCYGCHLKAPHLNAVNHSKKPDKRMRKQIKQAEEKHHVILPLDGKEHVMCVTCHNPHQLDVMKRESPAGKQVADADLEKGISYKKHEWNRVYRADKKARLEKLANKTGLNIQLDYKRIKTEVLLRLSARDGKLCLSCHEFDK